jgi:dihydrofolate reductase
MLISLIVATDLNNGIGKSNALLCHLPADLKYFRQTTTGHHIIMGRKTYESIGRPLPNRTNIIISSNRDLLIPGCVVVHSLQAAIDFAKTQGETEVFVTGGGTVYIEALTMAHKIYLTRIQHQFEADTFFPQLDNSWNLKHVEQHDSDEKNAFAYTFETYTR